MPPDSKTDLKRAQEDRVKFLKLLFKHGDLSTEAIAQALNISKGMADYHRDVLSADGMITETRMGFDTDWPGGSRPAKYGLLPKGREYVVKFAGG